MYLDLSDYLCTDVVLSHVGGLGEPTRRVVRERDCVSLLSTYDEEYAIFVNAWRSGNMDVDTWWQTVPKTTVCCQNETHIITALYLRAASSVLKRDPRTNLTATFNPTSWVLGYGAVNTWLRSSIDADSNPFQAIVP